MLPSPLESQVAKRKQKRMSKEELRTPDQVEIFLNNLWERVTKHKKAIIVAIVIFVGGGIAYALYKQSTGEAEEATAVALRGVFDPLVSPVVGDQETAVLVKENLGTNAYTDRKTQIAAALKGAEEFLSQNTESKAVAAVKFVQASSYAASGDAKKGATELSTWLSENSGSVLEFTAMMQLGDAQLASGQVKEARETYTKVVSASPDLSLARAIALTRLGDLDNPLMTKTGNGSEAVKSYEAAHEIVKGDGANPLSRELELKMALLK
jgi:predicted negative regulator of RcsB-dependent stress response